MQANAFPETNFVHKLLKNEWNYTKAIGFYQGWLEEVSIGLYIPNFLEILIGKFKLKDAKNMEEFK